MALELGRGGVVFEQLFEAGYGDLEELLENYAATSSEFQGHLPDFRPDVDL